MIDGIVAGIVVYYKYFAFNVCEFSRLPNRTYALLYIMLYVVTDDDDR